MYSAMSLFTASGAGLRRRVWLCCALFACAAPLVIQAQSTPGKVRIRARCARCASTMPDSMRERHERLLLRIDSLRWEFEHDRMTPEKRAQLSAEMNRAVREVQASLSGDRVAIMSGEPGEMPTVISASPEGFAYAIASARRGGTRGYLGVTFDGPSMEMWQSNERIIRFLDHPRISLVEASSPADRAGIEAGDTLLAFNGDDVVDKQISLTKLLIPEKRITMRIRRDGRERDYRIKIDTSPEYIVSRWTPSPAAIAPVPPMPEYRVEIPRSVSAHPPGMTMPPDMAPAVWMINDGIGGAKVESITEGLGKALGVSSGVLVITARPGTLAYDSGLREGDIILRASGAPVRTVTELRRIVERSGDDGTRLTIQRERRQKEITLR
jgi:PDZ domain